MGADGGIMHIRVTSREALSEHHLPQWKRVRGWRGYGTDCTHDIVVKLLAAGM